MKGKECFLCRSNPDFTLLSDLLNLVSVTHFHFDLYVRPQKKFVIGIHLERPAKTDQSLFLPVEIEQHMAAIVIVSCRIAGIDDDGERLFKTIERKQRIPALEMRFCAFVRVLAIHKGFMKGISFSTFSESHPPAL